MRQQNISLFALFCVVSLGFNAFVTGVPLKQRQRPMLQGTRFTAKNASAKQLEAMVNALKKLQLEADVSTNSNIAPRDWLSDLIWIVLNMTVGAFLSGVNDTLGQVFNLINAGTTQLEDVMNAVDPAVKRNIESIINNALTEASEITPVKNKLNLVLPSLSSVGPMTDPAQIIYAILGVTLEQFLRDITSLFEQCDDVLFRTIQGLENVAAGLEPGLANSVRHVTNEYMMRGRSAIRPVLDSLRDVLPTATIVEPENLFF